MNLKEEIRKIVQLQKIDFQIDSFSQDKDTALPAQLERLKNEVKEKKESLSSFEDKVKQLQLRRKDRELELASLEENVKKAQGHLYQLKTNREYQVKLSEIASLKADISIFEEEIINILDEIEAADKDLETAKDEFSQIDRQFKAEEVRLKEEIKEIEAKIKNLQDKREIFTKDIDKNILSKYEHLLKIRTGWAIAPVENENCGACHIRLTLQTINEIKMYTDLILCENCVRILYLSQDLEQ